MGLVPLKNSIYGLKTLTKIFRKNNGSLWNENLFKYFQIANIMEAVICNFRRGRHVPKGNHLILRFDTVDNRDKARKILGKKVSWKTASGKEIKGEIVKIHGNSGAVKAIFEKGMPGQCLGCKVKVI